MTIHCHILGFPRIGAQRELKFVLEGHSRGEVSEAALEDTGKQLRARHWALQREAGLDYVTVGDFTFYDQVANHIQLLGCEPARFRFDQQQSPLSRYFRMARGADNHADASNDALEMSKWFDTDYHYLVPEFSPLTQFSLACERLFDEVAEAQALGYPVKAALIGPLTFLWLGKEKTAGFNRLALLEQLLPVYGALLDRLKQQGVAWVQVDEPILGLDSGLHVDGIRAPHELISITDWLPVHKVLSIGIVDGRNIWRTDLDAAIAVLQPLFDKRGGKLWLAPSCSLLHTPFTLAQETDLAPEIKSWLAFATEKLAELALLKDALAGRRASERVQAPGLDEPVHGEAERNDMVEYFGEQLDGFLFTRYGWVQSYGSCCVKPPVIYGDVQRPAAMTVVGSRARFAFQPQAQPTARHTPGAPAAA